MTENRKEKLEERIRYRMHSYCDIVELALAIIVGLVLVLTAVGYLLTGAGLMEGIHDTSIFQNFLKNIFNLVVGIEFIKMLLKPNVKNVIDVLIFLITRHLIIGHSSPGGMLVCVISIILLYGFLFFLKYFRVKDPAFKQALESNFTEPKGSPEDLKDK